MLTYDYLVNYFTPEQLDNAALIACLQFQHVLDETYEEVYFGVLKEMWVFS